VWTPILLATTLAVARADDARDCPDADALVARTAAAGARTAYVSAARDAEVLVSFERGRARIVAPGGRARMLEDRAASCDGLAEAVVLALLLSGDDEAKPEPIGADPQRDEKQPPRRAGIGVRVGAGGELAIATIRGAAGGAQIAGHVGPNDGFWSIGVIGAWLPSSEIALATGSAEISYFGGGIEGCGHRSLTRSFDAALCARAEAGVMHGEAKGFTTNESHDRPLFAAALLLRGALGIAGPFGAYVEGGVRAPLHRERFAIESAGILYDPPPIAALAGAGLFLTIR
jgi:hypothetical protein